MTSTTKRRFLSEWFGARAHVGRELGSPKRFFTTKPEDLFELVEACKLHNRPCFCSVQPYRSRNMVYALEKLFFDFDSKTEPPDVDKAWNDAISVALQLKKHGIEPFLVATRRGFHVYAFLQQIRPFKPVQTDVAKLAYRLLQEKLLNGRSYSTLDHSVLGDVKRMGRVPYSVHEKSGLVCLPLNFDRQPIEVESIQVYRKHGISKQLFNGVFQKAERQKIVDKAFKTFDALKPKRPFHKKHRIRPCFTETLKTGEMDHLQRIALVYEAYCAGMSRNEIVELYRCLNDFDEAKTSYQIDWLLGRKDEKEIKPYRCKTIQKKGWCIGEKCPYFKGRKTSL